MVKNQSRSDEKCEQEGATATNTATDVTKTDSVDQRKRPETVPRSEIEVHEAVRRLNSEDSEERGEAAGKIVRLAKESPDRLENNEDGLLKALETRDEQVRRAAVVALGEVGSVRCVNKLSELDIPEAEEAVDKVREREVKD